MLSSTFHIQGSNITNEIKQKLAYEWKNIYRALVMQDEDKSGTIPLS